MEDRTKRRARLILVLGLVIAVLAGLGAFVTLSGSQTASGPPAVPTTPVVVAARDLPVRTPITQNDVRVLQYNEDTAPLTAVRDPKDAIGKVLTVAVAVGEPILPTKFAPAGSPTFTVFPPGVTVNPGQALPPNTPNYRAISISIPDANAVGGVLQPGDLVDILYTFNLDPTKYLRTGSTDRIPDFTSKVILQSVPILNRVAAVYTIRTDVETAERLAYLSAAGGTMQLLLRGAGDQRSPVTTGATFETVFDNFKPRVPQKVTAP